MNPPDQFDVIEFLKHLREQLSDDEAKHLVAYGDDMSPQEATWLLDPAGWKSDDMISDVFSNCKSLVLFFGNPEYAFKFPAEAQYSGALFLSHFTSLGRIRDCSSSNLAVANLIDSARATGLASVSRSIHYLAHLALTAPQEFIEARFFGFLGAITLSGLERIDVLSAADWQRLEAAATLWLADGVEALRWEFDEGDEHFLRPGWWRKNVRAAAKELEFAASTRELPAIQSVLRALA